MNGVKERRHRAILDLVRSEPVHTQHQLAQALARRGLPVTQATVSRDVQELGLVRTGAGYRAGDGVALDHHVLSVTLVEFLMVVKTPPGAAHLVARSIDEAGFEGVAGTVAGDDTVIVVLSDRTVAGALKRLLTRA